MRKFCLLIALFAMLGTTISVYSQGHSISTIGGSFPGPFSEIGNEKTAPSVSTGYYFMSNTMADPGNVYTRWLPGPNPDGTVSTLLSLNYEPELWFKIYSGPRQVPVNEVESGYEPLTHRILPPAATGKVPNEGYRYFRNPAQHDRYLNRLDLGTGIDTTTMAIAGPIPIGFAFYFNGLRYDSFYVSPRGIVALTNRRYLYDAEGNRTIPPNKADCYDPMSADWPFPNSALAPTQGRRHLAPGSAGSADPTIETTIDNYGWRNIACGGNPLTADGGIRMFATNADGVGPNDTPPSQQPSIYVRLSQNAVAGGAYLTPMEGNYYLPQFDEITNTADGYGSVYYKRSMASDKLIIYFRNLTLMPGTYQLYGQGVINYTVPVGRPSRDRNVLSGSCQVELNRLDSSITYRYGEWNGSIVQDGGGSATQANGFLQMFTSIAVGGYARHKSYDTKETSTWARLETDPWGGQYVQYTQVHNGYAGNSLNSRAKMSQQATDILNMGYQVKFKQYRNALHLTDVQYFVREKNTTATDFNVVVKTDEVQDYYDPFELLAGHEQLGQMQPVGIIQNLTNDIQSPTGVNFVEQDFQFQARILIRNKVTERYVYNRFANISEYCLKLDANSNDNKCGSDPYYLARYSNVTKSNGIYTATPITDEAVLATIKGIPPYGFVQVKFPRFIPNEAIENQIGLMEIQSVTEATNPNTGFLIGDEWPFDDTSKIDMWVIRRLKSFKSTAEFNYTLSTGSIPNVLQWVYAKFDARTASMEIVSAKQSTTSLYPLPPLGTITSENNERVSLNSPMFKMYWRNVQNKPVGSKITSHLVDMRNRYGSVATFAVQRADSDIGNTRRGFADATLYGPEPRVVFNSGYDRTDRSGGKIDNINNAGSVRDADFDYINIEYLKPSPDGVKYITMTGSDNNKDNNYSIGSQSTFATASNNGKWRYHPYFVNGQVQTTPAVSENAPALAVYGGGGYFVGFAFADGRTYYPANWNNAQNGTNDLYGGGAVIVYSPRNRKYVSVLDPTNRAQLTDPIFADGTRYIAGGLMFNPYDVGFDFEFYRYSAPIPDYFIDGSTTDQGMNFRFRVRVIETNDGSGDHQSVEPPNYSGTAPSDDNDVFFVDNVAIQFSNAITDIEAQVVKIIWPYSVVPASQANDLRIIVRVANMGTANAAPFLVKARAFVNEVDPSRTIYCQQSTVANLQRGQATEVEFSSFSPRFYANQSTGNTLFKLQAIITYPGNGDLDKNNDTTESDFNLVFGDEISYFMNASNEMAAEIGIEGKGLNLFGNRFSGYANPTPPSNPQQPEFMTNSRPTYDNYATQYFRYWRGDGMPWIDYISGGSLNDEILGYPAMDAYASGQIAMKFELSADDTIRSVRTKFGKANAAFDDISFNIYQDVNGLPGQQVQSNALPMYAHRMQNRAANGTETIPADIEGWITYNFNTPIRLTRGTYWLSIAQLGHTGLELAATGQEMGMRTTLVSAVAQNVGVPLGRVGVYGNNGIQLMLSKRFRIPQTNQQYGRVYVNNNVFAYKNVVNSQYAWRPFMPTTGHVAFAHLDHIGELTAGNYSFRTFTRGTWAPIMTPVFGTKTIVKDNTFHPCAGDDPNNPMGIEVVTFDGHTRNGMIELAWETASETNNDMFIIERTLLCENNWTEVHAETGAGTTQNPQWYNWSDENVINGNTYQYRLYMMDYDGAISCQNDNIVTVEYNDNRTIVLDQNAPNPFANETTISGFIPTNQNISIEIIDIFGKTIKTITNETVNGKFNYTWDGTNEARNIVADGNYIYRLTAGGEIITKKLSFIRSK